MQTALDRYKEENKIEKDGEAVLRHADFGHFFSFHYGNGKEQKLFLMRADLERLGISIEMSRERIMSCLRSFNTNYAIQKIIDFCSKEIPYDENCRGKILKRKPESFRDKVVEFLGMQY